MPGLLDPKPKQSPILGLLGTPPLTTMTPERFKAAGANLLNHQSVVGTAPNGQPITMSLGGLLNTGLEMAPGSGDYLAIQDFNRANQVGDRTGATLAAASLLPGIGDLAVGAKGLLAGKGALSMAGGLLGQTVFHGTPHNIPIEEGFRLDKIGTGEGAQAYGHGIYFAENPEVASQYRPNRAYVGKAMKGQPVGVEFDAEWVAQNAADEQGGVDGAIEHLTKVLDRRKGLKAAGQAEENAKVAEAINLLRSGKVASRGNLYTVDIPDEHIGKMLDWDKPLSEQPEVVRAQVERLNLLDDQAEQIVSANQDAISRWERRLKDEPDARMRAQIQANIKDSRKAIQEAQSRSLKEIGGAAIYRALSNQVGSEQAASQYLASLGIPGMRYLDAGSRGAKEGTRNIVLFDPSLAKIVKKE
jgi:hypothetical protein